MCISVFISAISSILPIKPPQTLQSLRTISQIAPFHCCTNPWQPSLHSLGASSWGGRTSYLSQKELMEISKSRKHQTPCKLDNSKLGSTQQQKICWHWHVARIISSQKIYGLYARKHHIVEMRGDVTDAGRPTEQLKIELLSQWKLEAESRNIVFVWGPLYDENCPLTLKNRNIPFKISQRVTTVSTKIMS